MSNYNKGLESYGKHKTRKDWRKFGEERRYQGIGKNHKKEYHRQMRNGKDKLRNLKNSQWKKLDCCNLWNWL